MSRVLVFFVDGVGIGPEDPARNAFTAAPPAHINHLVASGRASLVPLDATLGLPGLPQSGTGQYTLFTGFNGAQQFGRHYGPYVPTALRRPLMQDNILTRAQSLSRSVAFAVAYPEELIEAAFASMEFEPVGPLRAGPPLVAAGAGVLTRHTAALERGDAVASEITNTSWRERLQRTSLPIVDARTAGHNLAGIANQHDLTLFAHYATDHAGHEQDLALAIEALHKVDEFMGGITERLADDCVLLVVSDHGNLEDASTGHTRNPALGLVYGRGHAAIAAGLHSLEDAAPAVAKLLDRR